MNRIKNYIKTNFLKDDMLLLMKLAIPIIGSSLLHMAYNLTDMIWVGRLGSNAVAAIGTAGFFLNLGWALSSIISMGVGVKISHMVGAKDFNKAALYASTGLHGIIGLAIVYSGVLYFGAPWLIGFFQLDSPEVITQAVSYLQISALGIILSLVGLLFITIINSHGYTKISFRVSMFGTIANIILDPLLIFYFDMGVDGAAWATVLVQVGTLSLYYWNIRRQENMHFGKGIFSFAHLKEITSIGIPTSMQRVSFVLIYIVLARIIAEWGAVAIAVQKVGVQIESLSFMFAGGLTQAMAIAVGQQFGAKNFDRIKGIFREGLKLSLGIGAVASVVFYLFPEFLISIFINEEESIRMGATYLRILSISQLFMCLEMITAGAFNGLGKTQYPAKVSVSFTSLRLPAAYLLGFYTFLELDGVWWSISGSSIFKGIVLYMIFRKVLHQILDKEKENHNIATVNQVSSSPSLK